MAGRQLYRIARASRLDRVTKYAQPPAEAPTSSCPSPPSLSAGSYSFSVSSGTAVKRSATRP